MCLWFEGDLFYHIKFTVFLMRNGSHKITRIPFQERNPTKAIYDHEIKTTASFRDQVQKEGGGKKKKGHFSLAQYIYLSNVIVSLLVSQFVA